MSRHFPPSPVPARHCEHSMVFSADDDLARPSKRLLELSVQLIEAAQSINLSDISYRMTSRPYYPDIWPGEHYKLLAALIQTVKPKCVVEIGTAEGLSALAMKKFLPSNGVLHTFDIRPWKSVPGCVLLDSDFTDNRLVQHTENLESLSAVEQHSILLSTADIIFVDAAKDGNFEAIFLQHLDTIHFLNTPLVVFDDIKLWNMLRIWRDIKKPKLDLTSFGHWSGTGIVDWG